MMVVGGSGFGNPSDRKTECLDFRETLLDNSTHAEYNW